MESLDSNILNNEKHVLKDNSKRARIAGYIFIAICILSVIGAISSWFEWDLLNRIKDGGYYTQEEASMNDMRQFTLGIISIALNVASIVTFLNWFRRAYGNMERAGVKNTMHEEKNVGFSFVIPIVSLYRPFQIMKEIDEKTQQRIKQLTPDYEITSNSVMIIIWWTFYIIINVIGQFAFRSALKNETVDQMVTAAVVKMISDVLTVPAALATYFLIKNIAKKEALLAEGIHQVNLKDIYAGSAVQKI